MGQQSAESEKEAEVPRCSYCARRTLPTSDFETHGKISDEVDTTLEMLAARTPMDRGLAKTDMKYDLAVTLARGNAHAAATTIACAQRARDRGRAIHPAAAVSAVAVEQKN